MLMRVAVYIPPHTIGALCLIWLSSVNIDSTIVPIIIILYLMKLYNLTEIEQYMCTIARNR